MSMYGKNHYNIVVISLQLMKIIGEKKRKEFTWLWGRQTFLKPGTINTRDKIKH